jgi:hypothetical protein
MVTDDPEQAAAVVAAGGLAVLVVDDSRAGSLPWPEGPGRMALLVGREDDPVARAAAASMDRELFAPGAG